MAGRTDTGRSYTPPAPAPRYQGSSVATAPSRSTAGPTHEQIARKAREIWQAKGCPLGKDTQNWLEAEVQLRAEQRSR